MLDELAKIIAIQINVVLKGSSSVCFKMRTWDSETAGESGRQQKEKNYVELLAEEMWIQRIFGLKKWQNYRVCYRRCGQQMLRGSEIWESFGWTIAIDGVALLT